MEQQASQDTTMPTSPYPYEVRSSFAPDRAQCLAYLREPAFADDSRPQCQAGQ
jgi:hypothetical protein